MLNGLWAFMILAGVLWAAVHGNMAAVTQGALDAAAEAVALCVTMLGVMSLWTGILKIGERAGLIDHLAEKMSPVLRFLFPDLPPDHPANRSIAANMIANILGLGWAATPAGLKAMGELAELEEERRAEEMAGAGCAREPRRLEMNGKRSLVRRSDAEQGRRPQEEESAVSDAKGPAIGNAGRKRCLAAPPGTASREMCTFLIVNISSLQLIPINMIAYRSQYGSAAPAAIVGPAILATAVSTAAAVVFCRIMDRVTV